MTMILSAFRRTNYTEPSKRGGTGTKGNWREMRKLQKDATPLVLIPGGYMDPNPSEDEVRMAGIDPATGRPNPVMKDFYRARKHKCKTTRNGKPYFPDEVCSAGYDRHNPKPCAGCQAMDLGDKRLGVSDVFAYGFVHLVPYHVHPLWDSKDRKFIMKGDNSGPFMSETECAGRTCNFCRVLQGQPPIVAAGEQWPGYDPRSISTKFGGRRYLEMGKNHLENIGSWADVIAAKCANIDPATNRPCRAALKPLGFDCSVCGNVVIDLKTDPRTDAQINEAVTKPYPCMSCRQNQWLTQALECDKCAMRDLDPTQFPLIGTVLYGARRGESTASALVLEESETLEEFHDRNYNTFGALFAGKTVRQIVEEIGKPYDFDSLYAPRSLEQQAKRLDISSSQPAQPQGGYYQQQGGYPPPQQGGYPPPPPPGQFPPQAPPFQQGFAPPVPGQYQPAPSQYQPAPYPQHPAGPQPTGPQPTPPFVPGRPNYSS